MPTHTARLLELGTGWVHAYSLYPALLRSDELHCFDTSDNRHFKSFQETVPIVRSQIHESEYWTHLATAIAGVNDVGEAYRILGMVYQCRASGIPDYAAAYFDVIFRSTSLSM